MTSSSNTDLEDDAETEAFIRSLGGRELTPEESRAYRHHFRCADSWQSRLARFFGLDQ